MREDIPEIVGAALPRLNTHRQECLCHNTALTKSLGLRGTLNADRLLEVATGLRAC